MGWVAAGLTLVSGGVAVPGSAQDPAPPQIRAEALGAGGAVRLDGVLDEAVWASAAPLGALTQREPVEGAPAVDRTEVRFAYDDEALYVGAFLASDEPDQIRSLIARRDRDVPSEQLVISLDARRDRTTAYTFGITPGGVRSDYLNTRDREGSRDLSFDPVWEAATRIGPDGWTAELRIPFSQLRYNPGTEQVWGLNVVRRIPRRNEESMWVLVPRDATGWSSRMGQLHGLVDIGGTRRVEVLPYLAGGARHQSEVDANDPFAEATRTEVRAGADLKVGLGPSLTLDATFNPDFGQVEADPAEVNLSAFETFFSERRPFFLEGSGLFGGRGTFYSRRIGAAPPIRPPEPFAEERDNTTILGAAKLTGRLPSGLSVGALAAVTAEERVRTFDPDDGGFGETSVAPRTAYGVATVSQELGRDRSTIGAVFTGVDRSLDPGTPLATALVERAYAGLVDGRWRWAGGRYDVSAYVGVSHVEGTPGAIERLQRSSRRYYQRPDADHVTLDPTRTSLSGVTAGINHSKSAGSWRWDIDYTHETAGLELNDVGSLGATDDRGLFTNLLYRQTDPGERVHAWSTGLFSATEWNGGWTRTGSEIVLYGGVTWKNFWNTEASVFTRPRALSDNLTRGGPLMRTPQAFGASLEVANSSGARTRWELNLDGQRDELDGWLWGVRGTVGMRPGTRWDVSLQPSFLRRVAPQQYLATRPGGSDATFGSRYVFGRIDRSEISMRIRASVALEPNLTLEAYLEPFAAAGSLDRIGELRAAGGFDRRAYGSEGTGLTRSETGYEVVDGDDRFTLPNLDFDVRSFRSNLVLRWEWRPGSTLFLVWQQNRQGVGSDFGTVGPGGLFDGLTAPSDQFVALKLSYWLSR